VLTGPAVIEEFGSTVPLHPGFVARIDELANIIVSTRTSGAGNMMALAR
jgi:N-methylhydantoinase A